MAQGNKPVKKFRSFNICASVWPGEKGFTVTIQKSFKQEDGSYKDTDTFFQDDLPRLELVVRKAFEFIALTKEE